MGGRVHFGAVAMAVAGALLSGNVAGQTLGDAIADGEGSIAFRFRIENVDQDGINKDATALTLRTRVNYKSAPYNDFHLFVEADDVSYLGHEKFNNGRNGEALYPTIADPKGTGINQAYLAWAAGDTTVKLGRQRINIDTQRFVGGVGWRQNEQTYDALSIVSSALAETTLTYAYVSQVNRIFGPEDPAPGQQPQKWDAGTHLLNAAIGLGDLGTLNLYGFLFDFNDDSPANSNSTIGARLAGKRPLGSGDLLYAVEYASQRDAGDNPNNYSAAYYNLELGMALSPLTVKAGVEVLEGDAGNPGEVFITPLATAHKFQGWADKFLAHPAAGIEDRYLALTGAPMGTSVVLAYHRFDADDGGASYGSEVDLSIAKRVGEHVGLLLKFAAYNADDLATDTRKIWFMVSADF